MNLAPAESAASRGRRCVVLAGALLFVAYASLLFLPWDGPVVHWVTELVPSAVAAAGAAACLIAAGHASRRARLCWALFAAGAGAWAAGDLAYTVLDELGTSPTGAFTVADAGYLALVPAWSAALLMHPSRDRRLEQLLTLADTAAVMIAAITLVSAYILEPIIRDAGDVAGTLVLLAYPVGDLALLASFLALVTRTGGRLGRAELLIGLALLLFITGDIGYARLGIEDAYMVGSPVDLTWSLAFVALMAATTAPLMEHGSVPSVPQRALSPGSVVGVGVVIGLTVLALFSSRPDVLLFGAVLTGMTLGLRQVILLAENRRLMDMLAANVRHVERAGVAKEAFVAAASHQLRTPLTAIRLRLDELRAIDPTGPLAAEYMAEIGDEVRRLESLSSRLLTLLASDGVRSTGRVPLCATVRDAVRRLEPLATKRRISVAIGELDDAQLVAPDGAFEEVFLNLLDNAVKYSPEDGAVEIDAETDGAAVLVRVSDRGPGFDPRLTPRLLEPFQRASRSVPGHGLGLAIADGLCRASGARLDLVPREGGGTRATLLWPRAAEADAAGEQELGNGPEAGP